jgi:malonyl-CoA O-methyltransferase
LFDDRQLRRARSRAAAGHDAAAALPREIGARLIESLAYLDERVPGVALDVGSGTGHIADALRKRWPKTRVIALDASRAMLDQGRHRAGWLRPLLGRDVDRLQADPRALPLADASVDVLVAHLSLPWVDQLPGVFAGFRRVLCPTACCCARPSARRR